LDKIQSNIKQKKADAEKFTPWTPALRNTEYLDRDSNNVKMNMTIKPARQESKAAFQPGRITQEDLFANQVTTPQEYATRQRFIVPTTSTMKQANANKYESFQA
jgi:hypothetical protein